MGNNNQDEGGVKGYFMVVFVTVVFLALVFVLPPEKLEMIYLILFLVYLILIIPFRACKIFGSIKRGTSIEEEVEPQDLSKFQQEVKSYSNKKIDTFVYNLAREVKGKIEKNKYKNCRHMWE